MEQDLSTVLNDTTDGDGAMADSHYDTREDRDSRDVRERDRDSRDVRERDSGAGSSRNGYLSPKKEGGSGPDAAPAPPAEHYGRSRSPGRERYGSSRRTPYDRPGGDSHGGGSSKYSAGRRDPNRPPSKKECRVYVGNLAYEVGWQDLKDFMRKAGEVVFADILTGPGGRSKGCGVVEYAAIEEAQKAIKELNDTPLMGRPVFIREDREQEAKFGSLGPTKRMDTAGRQIFVNNLPYIVAWQDLKDLFRQAGSVLRADVMEGPDRRSRGMGVVLFETAEEAHHAISTFDGYEWHGRRLEVREDRHGGAPMGRGPPPSYGGPRGYDRPSPRGYDSRDYYGGGYDSYGPRDYYGGGYDGYGGGYGGYGGYYDRGYGGGPDYGPGGSAPPHRNDYYKDYPPPPPPPGTGAYAPEGRSYGERPYGGDGRGYGDRSGYHDPSRSGGYGDYHR